MERPHEFTMAVYDQKLAEVLGDDAPTQYTYIPVIVDLDEIAAFRVALEDESGEPDGVILYLKNGSDFWVKSTFNKVKRLVGLDILK